MIAMVNDLAPTIMKLWKKKYELLYSSFKHHVHSNREIFVFPEASHLKKLIRNSLLDHGFALNSSFAKITICSVHELIIKSKSDLNTTHNLFMKHLKGFGE